MDDLNREVDQEDESLAATQEAFERRAAARDADLSDDDGKQALIDELGVRLAWWEDTSLTSAHVVMSEMFGKLLDEHDMAQVLIANGAPADALPAELHLNWITGPLVMNALQLLGLFVPELREEIVNLFRVIPRPVETEEEREAIEHAMSKVKAQARAALAAMFESAKEEVEDAELGLGLN